MMRNTGRTVARPHLGDSRAVLSGRRIAAAGVVLLLAALLYALAAEARIGYDTAYQLVWGRELLDGSLPGYDVRLAPTPHPLQVLVAIPLALLGQGADEAMRALSLRELRGARRRALPRRDAAVRRAGRAGSPRRSC